MVRIQRSKEGVNEQQGKQQVVEMLLLEMTKGLL